MKDISVIIPTYNRATLLSQALDSCLRQRGVDLDIIVVDDCSTDDTPEVLKSYKDKIRYIPLTTRGGACIARNVGMTHASGRYVKFLDSDDILQADALAEELAVGDSKKADIVLSGWGTCEIDREGRKIVGSKVIFDAPNMEPLPDTVLAGRAVPISAALYKRSYIEDLEWDCNTPKLDDWDFFCMAALRYGRIASIPSIAFWWREHSGSRLSNVSMLENARCHHYILAKIENLLRNQGQLTECRAKRLAQYYYKELRILSRFDKVAFDKALNHIYELDPVFVPVDEEGNKYIRLLCRTIGVRPTLLFYSVLKGLRTRKFEAILK